MQPGYLIVKRKIVTTWLVLSVMRKRIAIKKYSVRICSE
jgi:hypothetical protein